MSTHRTAKYRQEISVQLGMWSEIKVPGYFGRFIASQTMVIELDLVGSGHHWCHCTRWLGEPLHGRQIVAQVAAFLRSNVFHTGNDSRYCYSE